MTPESNLFQATHGIPETPIPRQDPEKDLSRLVGFWSAGVATLLNATYLLILVANFALVGFTYPPPELTQLAASVVSLLGAPALVVVWLCLRRDVSPGRRVFVEIGIAFMVLLAAMTCINRYVYLVVVRQLTRLGETAWIDLIHPYGQHSIMFAIEFLGWGFFLGLACLFSALAFGKGRLEGWLRWLLVACGVLSLASALGQIVANPILVMAGFPAWGILLTLVTALLVVRFRRQSS